MSSLQNEDDHGPLFMGLVKNQIHKTIKIVPNMQ